MSSKTDGRGRIYLPADVREEFGDEYRIVKLPTRVALLPVDEDPLEGLQEAVGDAFDGSDHEELEAEARAKARADIADEDAADENEADAANGNGDNDGENKEDAAEGNEDDTREASERDHRRGE